MTQLLNNLPPTPIFSPVENWADDPLPCDLVYYSELPIDSAASPQRASDWICRSCLTTNHSKYENETCFQCDAVRIQIKKKNLVVETPQSVEEEWLCQRCEWNNDINRQHCLRCLLSRELQIESFTKDDEVTAVVAVASLCLAQQKNTPPRKHRTRGVRSGKKVRERRLAAIERCRPSPSTPPSA